MNFAIVSFSIGVLAACGDISNCGLCASQTGCGWCQARNACEPGTISAGADGYCNTDDGDWFWSIPDCVDAPLFGCSVCAGPTKGLDCLGYVDVSSYEAAVIDCPAAGCIVTTGIVSPTQDNLRMFLFTAGEYTKYVNGQSATAIAAGTYNAADTSCASKGPFTVSGTGSGAGSQLYLVGKCANTFSKCNMLLYLVGTAVSPQPTPKATSAAPSPTPFPTGPTPRPTVRVTSQPTTMTTSSSSSPTADFTIAYMYASRETGSRGPGCCVYDSTGKTDPVCWTNDDSATWTPCGTKCCPQFSDAAADASDQGKVGYMAARVLGSICGCCLLLGCGTWLCRRNQQPVIVVQQQPSPPPQPPKIVRSRRSSRTSSARNITSAYDSRYMANAYWTPTTPVPHHEYAQTQATPTSWSST